MFGDGQRQTDALNYEISTMRESKPRTTPQETSYLLVGMELATRPETLQALLLLLLLLNFFDRVSKNSLMSNFMKIGSVGAEFFHADGRTDRQTDRQTL